MTTLTIMVQSLQGLSHEIIFTPLTNMLVQTNWDSGKSSKYQRDFTSFDSSIPFSAATSSEQGRPFKTCLTRENNESQMLQEL